MTYATIIDRCPLYPPGHIDLAAPDTTHASEALRDRLLYASYDHGALGTVRCPFSGTERPGATGDGYQLAAAVALIDHPDADPVATEAWRIFTERVAATAHQWAAEKIGAI